MSILKELGYKELNYFCDVKSLKFKTTKEVMPSREIIGQGKTTKSLEFGLNIDAKGYNIYLSGSTGTGKTSFVKDYLKRVAKRREVPCDWCYVHNFDDSNQPLAISLPAGKGKVFVRDMDNLIKTISIEIPKAFDNNDYENEKNRIMQEFQDKRTELIDKLNVTAEKQGFRVKTTPNGIYFLPIINGEAITEEEFNDLDDSEKNKIMAKSGKIQLKTMDTIRKIKELEKKAQMETEEWENQTALFAVGVHVNDLMEKYKDYPKIVNYLYDVQKDILENIDKFSEEEIPEEAQIFLQGMLKKENDSPTERYKVNLLVDNSKTKGAPVIVDFNPTFYNLVGKIEYENEFGALATNYTMIKPGLLHNANGGYLVLQVKDVLTNPLAWEALKRCLRTGEVQVENVKDQVNVLPVATLKPEPIPLNLKVILVGTPDVYHLLYEMDDDFYKLFKVKVEFEEEMDNTEANRKKLTSFISSFCEKDKTLHFAPSGVAAVIQYSSAVADDQTKLSARFNDLLQILTESASWAANDKANAVEEKHVKRAMQEKRNRVNNYDKRMQEMILDNTILVDTVGSVVGQINGLAVIDMGDCVFGKPSRITANTFIGKAGIVNIEREADMSGTSHTKGVLILSAYIGEKYAQNLPLALTASLCFEQQYNGVDGDSASSTEVYAILSSLSGVPIKQGIAVTGSVNQKGEIQPIGGASDKIEGFFNVCKARKLTGEQGVIIPHQNVKNLHLNDEVIEAVKAGKFHIWSVKTIDEGIEILTGVKAGKRKEDGTYPKGTINQLAYDKLKSYAMTVTTFGKEENKKY
ncbi:MAG: AAA family ATPase [Clostridia bacterium]|nr:AAA family ATPase [Clostridia bacterium]